MFSLTRRTALKSLTSGNIRYSSTTTPPHGIAHPDSYAEARIAGEKYMKTNGFGMDSLVEQSVLWGEQDSFNHVNNVVYIRYFETGRMAFVASLLPELSEGSEKALIRGEGGIGVILAGISARYKRPVVFPDTLLVGHRPISVTKDRIILESVCWSYAQRAVTTTGEADMVTYDYVKLKKADMPADLFKALNSRISSK